MHKKAFTLIELALAILLAGVMVTVGYYYLNLSSMRSSHYKSAILSDVNLIESMVFQCKSLSEQMPQQIGGADALDTNLTQLECNTSTPYSFNGGKNGFVPVPPAGFTPFTATETGSIFYITTTADNNSTQDQALKDLIVNYTALQATLDHNTTSATFKFYLSR